MKAAAEAKECLGSGRTDFRKEIVDAHNFSISPGYLEASGMRLLSGRRFTWQDDVNSPPVVLANATFARMMFGNTPPVGQRFLLYRERFSKEVAAQWRTGNIKSLAEAAQPAMFFPLAQEVNSNDTVLVVRSALLLSEVAAALDRTLTRIDPNLPLTLHSWPGRAGPGPVSGASRNDGARHHGISGSHVSDHRDIWHGQLQRLEADEGIRDPW